MLLRLRHCSDVPLWLCYCNQDLTSHRVLTYSSAEPRRPPKFDCLRAAMLSAGKAHLRLVYFQLEMLPSASISYKVCLDVDLRHSQHSPSLLRGFNRISCIFFTLAFKYSIDCIYNYTSSSTCAFKSSSVTLFASVCITGTLSIHVLREHNAAIRCKKGPS